MHFVTKFWTTQLGSNELNSLVKLKCFFSYSVSAVCMQLNKNKIEIYIFTK